MKVLLIGGGGREHALGWKLVQSPKVRELVSAPGNPGLEALGRCVPVRANDAPGLLALAKTENPDLVVIGPEAPLAAGLADDMRKTGIAVFGPSAQAARLESSKAFTKAFCARHGIPTAASRTVTSLEEAEDYMRTLAPPFVLKADGLAAGKGVVIASTLDEAIASAKAMLAGQFGAASQTLVIEEFLTGVEASFFALSDGQTVRPLIAAQDHKRAFDGDRGPNTGGMGAFSPTAQVNETMAAHIMECIITPTITGMAAEGAPFCGVLFAGLMIDADGPKLIEFNVRFGDPECQVLMMRLQNDLAPLLRACATGTLDQAAPPAWDERAAACIIMAAKGYPGAYARGLPISLPQDLPADAQVFHAGTALDANGRLVSAGGRVLAVTALGDAVSDAASRAYGLIGEINFPGGFYRRDIGVRLAAKSQSGEFS